MPAKLSGEPDFGESRSLFRLPLLNHYCTLFDRRYAPQGLALWLSLHREDPDAVLWVLCLDEATAAALGSLREPNLRPVPLADLESFDPELAAARSTRSPVEYVFTVSASWPLFLFAREPDLRLLTWLDADTAFFSSPEPLWAELGAGSVLIVGHRFPAFLRELEVRGVFNVGVLCFRNDAAGRAVLQDWRRRCLEWCHDRVEPGRYADQKYLDAWPAAFPGVVVSANPGVNLAPWNWLNHTYAFSSPGLQVDGRPLIVFHFARFRLLGARRVDSGQVEYGVMPFRLRSWIYGRYWRWLDEARSRLAHVAPELAAPRYVVREYRHAWKTRLLEVLFGAVWWRVGPWLVSGGFVVGRYSGRILRWVRRRSAAASAPA
ncbi:MAG TPA: hypothetical protein VHE61_04175 [Opitutaceae bacterium]|nr:hypothetical protein [Opitutaceae bacterium]